jgi:hypothetical protein
VLIRTPNFTFYCGWLTCYCTMQVSFIPCREQSLTNRAQHMNERATKSCAECRSYFFAGSSQMNGLCPECAHLLYGYDPCIHSFVAGRCSKCYWDGSVSAYCKSLKQSTRGEDGTG